MSPMVPYSLTNSERHSPPERMKEVPAYSSDRDVYFVPLLSLHLQYQAMLSNAAASAAPCCMARRSLQHLTALLDTEDAKTAVTRRKRHDLTSMPVLLSFFAVGCVVHCSSMSMAPSATLASTREGRQLLSLKKTHDLMFVLIMGPTDFTNCLKALAMLPFQWQREVKRN